MAHHIQQLTIHAFRGLRDVHLNNLGRVNLFVGLNNSGKTSVLEAISLVCNPLDPAAWYATARRRRFGSRSHGAFEPFLWLFPRDQRRSTGDVELGRIEISLSGEYPLERLLAEANEIVGEEPEDEEDEDEDMGSSSYSPIDWGAAIRLIAHERTRRDATTHIKSEPIVTFDVWTKKPFRRRSAETRISLPSETLTPVLHYSNQAVVWRYSEAAQRGHIQETIKLLRELDPGITGLTLLEPPGIARTVYLHHESMGDCPVATFGDGIRRALLIALTLPSVENGVLLIDDIEQSLHVDALRSVYSWLVHSCNALNVQLFATTHSLEAIDAILATEAIGLDDVSSFRIERREGMVSARPFSGEMLHRLRYERGLDVR